MHIFLYVYIHAHILHVHILYTYVCVYIYIKLLKNDGINIMELLWKTAFQDNEKPKLESMTQRKLRIFVHLHLTSAKGI